MGAWAPPCGTCASPRASSRRSDGWAASAASSPASPRAPRASAPCSAPPSSCAASTSRVDRPGSLLRGLDGSAPYHLQPIAYRRANPRWRRLTGDVDFASPDAEEVNLRSAILQSEGIPHKLRRRSPWLGRLGMFANAALGQDPEGDDRQGMTTWRRSTA